MAEITCQKCGHVWISKSNGIRICCSKCRSSISVAKTTIKDREQIPSEILTRDRELRWQDQQQQIITMPVEMAKQLNKFMLARLIGMAAANSDKSIKFKVDNHGVMSLD